MTAYKLRPGMEAFEVVDGPYAGKKYKAGIVYRDVPPQERHRFEPMARFDRLTAPSGAEGQGAGRKAQGVERKAQRAEHRAQGVERETETGQSPEQGEQSTQSEK